MEVVISIVLLFFIELIFSPRIDWTDEDEILLWYYPILFKKRNYIKLYPII